MIRHLFKLIKLNPNSNHHQIILSINLKWYPIIKIKIVKKLQ